MPFGILFLFFCMAKANKKSTTHCCAVPYSGGEYRAVLNHGDLLQSMHGALPAELIAHSFVANKKSTTHCCAVPYSGGEYRDRTGDLLHAMQALSQLS